MSERPLPFRTLVACSLGALVASATACAHEYRYVGTVSPAPVVASPRVVTVGEGYVRTPSNPTPPVASPVTTDVDNTPPPAMGVTEVQPGATPSPGRQPESAANASPDVSAAGLLLDESSRQANRIRLAWQDATEGRRAGLASTLADLESSRALVRDDLKQIDLGTAPSADAHERLRKNVAALRDAMRASYAFLPPTNSGLPQPSPMPPTP
jgi:hypothetical protein